MLLYLIGLEGNKWLFIEIIFKLFLLTVPTIRDTTRVDYIKNGLKGLLTEFGLSDGLSAPCAEVHSLSEYDNQMVEDVTNTAITSLISQVKELLPDLDDDFVKVCHGLVFFSI